MAPNILYTHIYITIYPSILSMSVSQSDIDIVELTCIKCNCFPFDFLSHRKMSCSPLAAHHRIYTRDNIEEKKPNNLYRAHLRYTYSIHTLSAMCPIYLYRTLKIQQNPNTHNKKTDIHWIGCCCSLVNVMRLRKCQWIYTVYIYYVV